MSVSYHLYYCASYRLSSFSSNIIAVFCECLLHHVAFNTQLVFFFILYDGTIIVIVIAVMFLKRLIGLLNVLHCYYYCSFCLAVEVHFISKKEYIFIYISVCKIVSIFSLR